jgi:opacity protein-like surface antigen
MRRLIIFTGSILLAVAATDARAFSIGGHAVYSKGGDVSEESTGFGIQAAARINDTLSIRVSGTGFSDSDNGMNLDITSIALSGLAGTKLTEQFEVYAGGGVNLNVFHGHIDLLELASAGQGMSIEQFAQDNGVTVAQAQAFFSSTDVTINANLDDTFGYHVCAGAAWEFVEGIQLFGEYSFNWAKLKGDISFITSDFEVIEKGAMDTDYNFGLITVGINFLL